MKIETLTNGRAERPTKDPMCLQAIGLIKVPRIQNRKRTLSLIKGVGNTGFAHAEE
jgi:hypothetical protein